MTEKKNEGEKKVLTPPANEIDKMKLSELFGKADEIPEKEFEKRRKQKLS